MTSHVLFVTLCLLDVSGRSEDSVKYSEEKDKLERSLHTVSRCGKVVRVRKRERVVTG